VVANGIRVLVVAPLLGAAFLACGASRLAAVPSDASASGGNDAPSEAAASNTGLDAMGAADVDKAAPCATTFGDALTNAFGRADGTVVAVVPPDDQACTLPNSTHLVIQIEMMGAVYRMVVDVLSDTSDPDVLLYETDAPLADGAWAEGWHPGVSFDYVGTLGVHSTSFTTFTETPLVQKITAEIDLGAPISVFSTSDGEPNSAHLVHRNVTNQDGAIVIHPEASPPHYILLSFPEQTF
jgi:hypothetical protein